MLDQLYKISDIKQKLENNKLYINYVCEDGEVCSEFSSKVDSEKINVDKNFLNTSIIKLWWIDFDREYNKFILYCSYFDENKDPITREQFIDKLRVAYPDKDVTNLAAANYSEKSIVTWEQETEGEWIVKYNSNTPSEMINVFSKGPLRKILLKEKCIQYIKPTVCNDLYQSWYYIGNSIGCCGMENKTEILVWSNKTNITVDRTCVIYTDNDCSTRLSKDGWYYNGGGTLYYVNTSGIVTESKSCAENGYC